MISKQEKVDSVNEHLVYIGDRPAAEMNLTIIIYDAKTAHMEKINDINELINYKSDSKTTWINVAGLKDIDSIKKLCEMYKIHPLTIEDILNTEQQPKTELFDEYRFLSLKTIQREKNFDQERYHRRNAFSLFINKYEDETEEFLIDQVSIIVMKDVLITFQEESRGSFNNIRKKIQENAGEFRKAGTGYLAYSIIDAVVDEYFLTLNHIEEDIENFEERATKTSDATFIQEIQDTKKYLLQIKRAISPLKVIMLYIYHHGTFFNKDKLKPFLQDLNDHINQAITMVETHREWLTNIMEVNLSVLSHQMNRVMKVLAIISTIFIPLTFIAGIYGMNFEYMPELTFKLGYPITLAAMGLIGLSMVVIFKIHRWF